MISTIEVAKRLGITCLAVNKRIKQLQIEKIKRGVYAYVKDEDFDRIARLPQTPSEQSHREEPSPSPVSDTLALQQQLEFLQNQLREQEHSHAEQLQQRQQQLEHERFTANHRLEEKEKLLMEAIRERAELRVLLFREQELHNTTKKELAALDSSIEVEEWISFLETTHQTFIENMKTLSHRAHPPLIVHEGGKSENPSFYTKFAK